MTTLVLLHGAWHGAWVWNELLDPLGRAGHDVIAPDLPGADGDGDSTLADQAKAVSDILDAHDGVVLVAHSHAGLVAQEATAHAPERVLGVVGVDAWFARGRGSFLDVVPDRMAQMIRANVVTSADRAIVPVPPATMFGIDDPTVAAEIEPLLTPQPYATFSQPGSGFSFRTAGIPGVAIVTQPRTLGFDQLGVDQGFPVWPITSGHDVMLLRPTALTDLLLQAVSAIEIGAAPTTATPASV